LVASACDAVSVNGITLAAARVLRADCGAINWKLKCQEAEGKKGMS